MNAFVVARSGNRINLTAPRKDLILARDIAEALAKMCMYRGATFGFYTMAQHSMLVAIEASRGAGALAGLYALLHHAGEAYGVDHRPDFMPVLHGAFALDWPAPQSIAPALTTAHFNVEVTELRQLCAGRDHDIAALEAKGAKPLRAVIKPLAWDRAMDRYVEALRVYAVAAQLPRTPAWGDVL